MTPDPETPIKPRLWVLTTTFPRWLGDAEPPFVFELSRRLAKQFEVTVLAPRAPRAAESEQLEGVSVRRYPYCLRPLEQLAYGGGILGNLRQRRWRVLLVPLLMLGLWRALRAAIRDRRVDVIHAHWFFPQGWVATFARSQTALVVTAHGADVFALRGTFWNRVRARVSRIAFAVTAVSQAMAHRIPSAFARPIEIIPMGVDLQQSFVPVGGERREADHLLFAGRLVPKKGVDVLLRALALLAVRGRRPLLTVAGSGPERSRLQALAAQLGLTAQVTWRGAVANTELPALYRSSTALIAPFAVAPDGDREGFGLVVVEAMGCECPVVTTELARVNPAVSEQTAWIAAAGDPASLATTIAETLEHPAEAARRSRRAREAVLAAFDWEIIAARYADLLHAAADCGSR